MNCINFIEYFRLLCNNFKFLGRIRDSNINKYELFSVEAVARKHTKDEHTGNSYSVMPSVL